MCMAKILDAAGLLRKVVEMVHDDHAGFATEVYNDEPDGRSHFHLLRRYLKVCSEHRLRLSPKKFTLFSKEADISSPGCCTGTGACAPTHQAIRQ